MQIPDNQLALLFYTNATFEQRFDLYGPDDQPMDQYPDAEWQLVIGLPGGDTVYTTTEANWTVISDYQRICTIPMEDTADFPHGPLVCDINLIISPTDTRRIVARAQAQCTLRIQPNA